MTRIGILSAAHMHAHSYVEALGRVADVTVAGIFDDDPERGRAFAAQHHIPWVDRAESLLDEVDGVVICSENARHRQFVEMTAPYRRPMLTEKPLATSAADGRALIRAAEEAGAPLFMALPVRFSPPVAALRAAVRAGQIGRPIAMVGTNHGYLPPGWFLQRELSGGGAVMDHTPHVADVMFWVLGSEVRRVYAEVDERMHHTGIDDCGILTLEFEHGAFATLDPSWSRPKGFPTWGDVTLEVVGTGGVLQLDAFRQHLDLYVGDAPTHRYLGFGEDMDQGLIEAFVRAVRGEDPGSLARGEDGLRALGVALAAYRSAAEHRPVAISEVLETTSPR